MPRKWKNSDDMSYFVDKTIDSRLEKLRYELIKDYSKNKYNKKNNNKKSYSNNKRYTPKNNNGK